MTRPYVKLQVVDAQGSGKAVHSAAFNLNIQALEAYNKAVALVAVGSTPRRLWFPSSMMPSDPISDRTHVAPPGHSLLKPFCPDMICRYLQEVEVRPESHRIPARWTYLRLMNGYVLPHRHRDIPISNQSLWMIRSCRKDSVTNCQRHDRTGATS